MQGFFPHRLRVLVGPLLVLAGAQAAPAAPPADVAAGPAVAARAADADRSLTPAGYVAAGLPDPGHPWSADEVTAAARALARIAAADPEQLPSEASGRSGAVFARIVSAENTSACRLPSAPGDAGGLTPCIRLGLALDSMVKSYAHAGDDELAMLFGADLRAIAALIRLSDRYKLSDGVDPEAFTALVSAEGTRSSTPRLVADGLAVLREPWRFGPGVVDRYIDTLRDVLPAFLAAMDAADRDRLLPLLAAMRDDPAKRDFRAAFEQLAAEVETALRAAPAGPRNKATLHRAGVCTADPGGGCLARSTGGGFSVWLPGAYDDVSVDGPIRSPYGSSARAVHMLGASDRAVYQALELELAGGKPTDALALGPSWKARGFAVERTRVQTPQGSFDEVRLRSDAETLVVRSRRVGSAVYRLSVRYRADVPPAEVQPSMARFFASLEVAGKGSRATHKPTPAKKRVAKKPHGKKATKKKR